VNTLSLLNTKEAQTNNPRLTRATDHNQNKPSDPKNDKPANHLQLAKRSMTGHDKPTDHPKLARRTIDKPNKPTIHPNLVKRSMHEPFDSESLA
jgi:hypothetical protein